MSDHQGFYIWETSRNGNSPVTCKFAVQLTCIQLLSVFLGLYTYTYDGRQKSHTTPNSSSHQKLSFVRLILLEHIADLMSHISQDYVIDLVDFSKLSNAYWCPPVRQTYAGL